MTNSEMRRGHTVDDSLRQWRSSLLDMLLKIGVAAGLPSLFLTAYRAIANPSERIGAVFILLIYSVLVGMALQRGPKTRRHGWFVLAVLYLLGVIAFVRSGLVGDGRIYMALLPIFGLMLVDVQTGIITTAISLTTYILFGIFANLGLLNDTFIVHINPVTPDHWLYDGFALGALLISCMYMLISFYQFLIATLISEINKSKNLSTTNQELDAVKINLEKTIQEQTAQVKQANLLLQHLAQTDALTGLPNQEKFYQQLQRAISRSQVNKHSAAVLFIDLDGFKLVNDNCGHPAGDVVLKAVVTRFLKCIRQSDTLARFGGDEFVIILENLNAVNDAMIVIKKLFKVMETPFKINNENYPLTLSMGVSLYPNDTDDAHMLIKYADTAMYQVKHSSKNGYQFYANM